MSNFPPTYSASVSAVDDLSRDSAKENLVHKDPPVHVFVNPSTFNNTNNAALNTVQYQPQSQWGTIGSVGNTSNIIFIPSVMNPELAGIDNYKGWSILNILCCCLCLGLVACHYSSKTDNFKARGDMKGAINASRNARRLNIIATVIGIIVLAIYIYFRVTLYQ